MTKDQPLTTDELKRLDMRDQLDRILDERDAEDALRYPDCALLDLAADGLTAMPSEVGIVVYRANSNASSHADAGAWWIECPCGGADRGPFLTEEAADRANGTAEFA